MGAGAAPKTRKAGKSAHAELTQGVFPWIMVFVFRGVPGDSLRRYGLPILKTSGKSEAQMPLKQGSNALVKKNNPFSNKTNLRLELPEYCWSRAMPLWEWKFAFREALSEFRELLRELSKSSETGLGVQSPVFWGKLMGDWFLYTTSAGRCCPFAVFSASGV